MAVVAPHWTPAELQYTGHEQPPVLGAEGSAEARPVVGALPCYRNLLDKLLGAYGAARHPLWLGHAGKVAGAYDISVPPFSASTWGSVS